VPLADRLPLRLLLADDNVVNQKVGAGLLKQLGYDVDISSSGAEVLEALDARPYDIILLDVHMPVLDGLETARRIRARWAADEAARPLMIAMTASASRANQEECFGAGMDDYLSKPLQIEPLRAALERSGSQRRRPA
jgi:CheY-like chemotaxis protein